MICPLFSSDTSAILSGTFSDFSEDTCQTAVIWSEIFLYQISKNSSLEDDGKYFSEWLRFVLVFQPILILIAMPIRHWKNIVVALYKNRSFILPLSYLSSPLEFKWPFFRVFIPIRKSVKNKIGKVVEYKTNHTESV